MFCLALSSLAFLVRDVILPSATLDLSPREYDSYSEDRRLEHAMMSVLPISISLCFKRL